MYNKITVGFVAQKFDESGKCVSQEFIAGDQVDYERDGEPIDVPVNEVYYPFDMVQPKDEKVVDCLFTSKYEDGSIIITPAIYNQETGETEPTVVVDMVLDSPEREYITLRNGSEIEVCPICHDHVMKTVMEEGEGKQLEEKKVCSGGCKE